MNTNLISQKLLAEGWTKELTPPGMKPWDDFYGGWTYSTASRVNAVFETPCGLLLKRSECSCSGFMSFMGVDWSEENDNMTILCPHYARSQVCELNHPLLRGNQIGGSHYENLCFCAVHETNKPWCYEHSRQKIEDDAEAEKKRLFEAFKASRDGHVCEQHCRFDRSAKQWSMDYDPQRCLDDCTYCPVLNKELSPKKAHVFYDLKVSHIQKGEGIFPDKEQITINKGIKLFKHPRSETLCEAIVKTCRESLQHAVDMQFQSAIQLEGYRYEVMNIRLGRREKRDSDADLLEEKAGIVVLHKSDADKAEKARRSARRADARKKKELRKRRVTEAEFLAADSAEIESSKAVWVEKLGKPRYEELCRLRSDRENGIGEQFGLFGG